MPQFQVLKVDKSRVSEVVAFLQQSKDTARPVNNPYLVWAGSVGSSIISVYSSGKIVFDIKDEQGQQLYDKLVQEFNAPPLKISSRRYSIGCDETGTGEIFGRVILSGVVIGAGKQKSELDTLVKLDTKKGGNGDWLRWLKYEQELTKLGLIGGDLPVASQTVALDNGLFNKPRAKNKLMDKYYQNEIIAPLIGLLQKDKVPYQDIEVVVDDYGVGAELKNYLQDLRAKGVAVIVQTKADDTFASARLAAIIAKIKRAHELEEINQEQYKIDGMLPGNGNVNKPETLSWLKAWWRKHKSWPWFVKQWFKTADEVK